MSTRATRASRDLGVALATGAALGALYAVATDAGHLALGYVLWGAIVGGLVGGLVRAARAIYGAPRR